jgi:uncharacterized protein
MRAVEVIFPGGLIPIEGYAPGAFRIRGGLLAGPLALTPEGALAWDGLPDLAPFITRQASIDVLLIGIGTEMVRPDAALAAEIARAETAGMGVDVMATPSACRTYNVLLSEGRRIAAALTPV